MPRTSGPSAGAEGGERLVPGGPRFRGGGGGFGADWVGGVVVAGQFAPGADGGGPFLPVQPGGGMTGNRAEGGQGLGLGMLGGVLADAVLAGVHQRGDLGDVGAALRIGDRGYPGGSHQRGVLGEVGAAVGSGERGSRGGPRSGGEGDERAGPAAQAGVEDGG